jgi:CRP-like cAMP-binding protein
MAKSPPPPPTLPENRLLAALPPADRERLLHRADEVTLARGDVVYRANGPIHHVYFPRTGILSMVIDMEDGGTVEVGTIGLEGMVGLPAFHGAGSSPTRVYCQVPPCVCRRVPAEWFRAEAGKSGALQAVVNRFAEVAFALSAQSVACNRLHPVEQRLARWLLMTHDRVIGNELNLTQEILAEMLGVRRASVTTAAGTLQRAGLIQYRRGRVTVHDRPGLEATACECYRIVRNEFARLLNGRRHRHSDRTDLRGSDRSQV